MRSKRKNKVSKGRLRQSKVRKTSLRKNKKTQRRKSKKSSRKTRRSFIKKSRKNNRKLKGGAQAPEDEVLENLVGRWEVTGTTVNAIRDKLSEIGKKELSRLMLIEGHSLDDILEKSLEAQNEPTVSKAESVLAAAGYDFNVTSDLRFLADKDHVPTETEFFTVQKIDNGYTGKGGPGEDSFTLENIQVDSLENSKVSMEQVYSDDLRTKWSFNISSNGNNLEIGEWYALKGSDYEGKKIGNFTAQRVKTAPQASQLQSTEHPPAQVTVNPRAQASEGGVRRVWFEFGRPTWPPDFSADELHRLLSSPFYLNEDGSEGGGDGFRFDKIVSGKGKTRGMGPPVTMVQVFDDERPKRRWFFYLPRFFSSLKHATKVMAEENPSTSNSDMCYR